MGERQFLLVRDVARILGEERARQRGEDPDTARPFSDSTVWRYSHANVSEKPGRKAGRYADNPMPAPEYLHGRALAWFPADGETVTELEQRIRVWYRSRPGPGAGGGRPPKQRAAMVSCPCECGEMVAAGTMCDRSAAASAKGKRR